MKPTICSLAVALIAIALPLLAPGAAHANAWARAEVSRTIDRTVPVSGAPLLTLMAGSAGDLVIRTHARPEVRIVARIRVSADSRETAQEFMNTIAVDVAESPGRVTVDTRRANMGWRYRKVGFAIDMEVVMPERMPLEATHNFGATSATGLGAGAIIRNTQGRLTVADGRGRFQLENRFGPIEAHRLTGDLVIVSNNGVVTVDAIRGTVTATNAYGPVTVTDVEQAVSVENSNGTITLRNARGGAALTTRYGAVDAQSVRGGLRVDNRNGNITAVDVDGQTQLSTGYGLVTAGQIRGPLVIDNHNGGIRVAGASGSLKAVTNYGAVSVSDVDGRIDIRNNNGGTDVALAPKSAPCHAVGIRSGYGPIVVYLGGGGYALRAFTKYGRVNSSVPITLTGTIQSGGEKGMVIGTIGNGACMLELTNDNGNIAIQPGPGPAVSLDVPGERAPRAPRARP